MALIGITGATGFIGAALSAAAGARGHSAVCMSRKEAGADGATWRLGETLPAACARADAIVHLACATLQECEDVEAAVQRDLNGTRLILEQVRAWRAAGQPMRFLFVSSQSSRADAVNHYGRSKWRIEGLLEGPDEIIVRPGFVYSDPPAGVFAAFCKTAQAPFVPIISPRPAIQPIHVDELSDCLLRLCTMASPPRVANLGAAEPLTFQQAISAVARSAGRAPPLAVKLPAGPVRLAANTLDRLIGSTLTERVDGLLGLEPFETESSLKALDIRLKPFMTDGGRAPRP